MSAPAAAAAAASADVSSLPVIRVGGVPEHFNIPWQLAQEVGGRTCRGGRIEKDHEPCAECPPCSLLLCCSPPLSVQQHLFERAGVRVEWHEFKLGTGAMISALKAGEVDLIVALTEGIVGDIAQNAQAQQTQSPSASLKILGTYVESPLCWAISTGAHSAFNEVADLRGQSIGISRFTSGSHLMSCVLATQRGWDQSDVKYVVLGSFAELRAGVNAGTAAAFMWEQFTTKPFYDSGEIRRIGQIVTPWPCFLLCSSKGVLADPVKRAALHAVQRAMQESCRLFHSTPGMADEVANRCGLRAEDAKAWYDAVRITASGTVAESTLEGALQALKDAGILTSKNYPMDLPLTHFVSSGAEEGSFVRLEADIKSMRLYHRPELLTALFNNIRVRLHKEKGPLNFQELQGLDQNHYVTPQQTRACERGNAHLSLTVLASALYSGFLYTGGYRGARGLRQDVQAHSAESLGAAGVQRRGPGALLRWFDWLRGVGSGAPGGALGVWS